MKNFKPTKKQSFKRLDKSFAVKTRKRLEYKSVAKDDISLIGSLLGRTDSASKMLRASDLAARAMFRQILGEEYLFEMKRREEANLPVQGYLLTALNSKWNTGTHQAMILIDELRKGVRKELRGSLDNYVAAGELQAFQNVKHASGGNLISVHAHGIWFPNSPINHQAIEAKISSKFSAPDGIPPFTLLPISNTESDWVHVIGYPLKAPAKFKTEYKSSQIFGKRNLHESEKGDRYIRYYRMFDILATLPLDKLVFGQGDGRFIVTRAISRLRAWHATRAKHCDLMQADKVNDTLDRLRRDILGDKFAAPTQNFPDAGRDNPGGI